MFKFLLNRPGFCSLEHNLPDNLFASPKAAGDYATPFSIDTDETEKVAIASVPSSANNNLISSSLLPATSTLDIASLKSCYFHVPRYFLSLTYMLLIVWSVTLFA